VTHKEGLTYLLLANGLNLPLLLLLLIGMVLVYCSVLHLLCSTHCCGSRHLSLSLTVTRQQQQQQRQRWGLQMFTP
jgi:hypothetical protein